MRCEIIACTLFWLISAKTHLSESFHHISRNLFLPLLPLDHQEQSSSDHHTKSCACSSPKNTLPVPLNLPLPFAFSFAFSSPHLATFERSGLPSILDCRPMSKNTVFHHQYNLAHWLLRLWAIVQIRPRHQILYNVRFCSCSRRVNSWCHHLTPFPPTGL